MYAIRSYYAAAIKAAEAVDACIGRLDAAVAKMGGAIIYTADHGNAEQMLDPTTGGPYTAHTVGPVRAVLRHAPAWVRGFHGGKLSDVAPTLLAAIEGRHDSVLGLLTGNVADGASYNFV